VEPPVHLLNEVVVAPSSFRSDSVSLQSHYGRITESPRKHFGSDIADLQFEQRLAPV
jgi:hypothetical protein